MKGWASTPGDVPVKSPNYGKNAKRKAVLMRKKRMHLIVKRHKVKTKKRMVIVVE